MFVGRQSYLIPYDIGHIAFSGAEMAAFISVPLKKSSEVDLIKPLSKFVTASYPSGEEQAEYLRAVEELNKLRKSALGRPLDKHENSLEILLRYSTGEKRLDCTPDMNSNQRINVELCDSRMAALHTSASLFFFFKLARELTSGQAKKLAGWSQENLLTSRREFLTETWNSFNVLLRCCWKRTKPPNTFLGIYFRGETLSNCQCKSKEGC